MILTMFMRKNSTPPSRVEFTANGGSLREVACQWWMLGLVRKRIQNPHHPISVRIPSSSRAFPHLQGSRALVKMSADCRVVSTYWMLTAESS